MSYFTERSVRVCKEAPSFRPGPRNNVGEARDTTDQLKFCVGRTSSSDLLETEGLVTQGSRPGRSAGYLVGGRFGLDGSDWSNGLQYHIFDTKPGTEFKLRKVTNVKPRRPRRRRPRRRPPPAR